MHGTARCHCGQLRVTVTVAPVHVHACTCTLCQRTSGSVGGWNGWFPDTGVTVEGRFSTYHMAGPDYPDQFATFCPVCGSGGFGKTGAYLPDCTVIAMGGFADPDRPEPLPAPRHVHHWANRPEWLDDISALPRD